MQTERIKVHGFGLIGFCKHDKPVWDPHPAMKKGVLPPARRYTYDFLGYTYFRYTTCKRCRPQPPFSFIRHRR